MSPLLTSSVPTEATGSFIPQFHSIMKRAINAPSTWAFPNSLPLTNFFYDDDEGDNGLGGGRQGHGDNNADNEGFKGFNSYPTAGGFNDKFGPLIPPDKEKPKTKTSNNWHDEPAAHNETKWVSCGNFSSYKDYSEVVCTPRPNAFNPCEDVMGYEWLRVLVWFVLLAALCGNLVVMIVLITARSKLTVPKFLMCNLSFADFLMGLYLLLIASVDVHTLGEYFTHAVTWQNDGGCQVAGFLTVFSSELSVFVLTVITLERWYAISQAIHVNKRLRMRQATFLMFAGWIYASCMGVLPLLGVSGYGAVSMCLPMEAKDIWDIVYIVSLLVFNGCAFMAICGCYISMFLKVRASENMARSNDATIAKRMAILVMTNFICWAPIAFFGLTASFGFPLIDITKSKILLVFFFPFNSCANPFLYAILTKQFRRDVFILLGRYGICTERANKYKGTSMTRSYSNSRNNGLVLNTVHNNATDVSLLSQYSKLSKGSISLNGITSSNTSGTPKATPQNTPQDTPCTSPKSTDSPVKDGPSKTSFSFGNFGNSPDSRSGKNERKLSTVIETSHTSEGPSDDGVTCTDSYHNNERVLEARDSLRDLFDGKPHGRVRSASEYVVIFRASSPNRPAQPQQQQCPQKLPDYCGPVSSRGDTGFERQTSRDTVLSSNTLNSFLSDFSSSRRESDNETHNSERKIFPLRNNSISSDSTHDSLSEKRSSEYFVHTKPKKNYPVIQDLDSAGETESLLSRYSSLDVYKTNTLNSDENDYKSHSKKESLDFIEELSINGTERDKESVENGYDGDNDEQIEEDDEMNQNYLSGNENIKRDELNIPTKPARPSCLTSHRVISPDRRVSFCDDTKSSKTEKKKTQPASKSRLSLFKRSGKR